MDDDLYQVLEISRNAGPEDIRKAYRRRALQTHPDRLPPNSTAAAKASAEDQFRKINNAYEILKDDQKRRAYDIHGVWPPPREDFRQAPSHHDQYRYRRRHHRPNYPRHPDPFFAFPDFRFTDPFELFDSIFNDPRRHSRHRSHRSAFHDDNPGRFHHEIDDFLLNMHRNVMSTSGSFAGMGMGMGMRSHFPAFPSVVMDMGSDSGGGSGRWASESTMSQTINGQTHTIVQRRDWEGNEHSTCIYPDGHKVVTINGVEQSDQARSTLPPHSTNNYLSSPPPPYSANPGPVASYGGLSERPVVPSYRDTAPYNNEDNVPSTAHSNSSKKRWWSR
ncbi:hypothetical protein D9757_012103 [Collybiopsis confluens]|uniref:J domain-containing protein n=1 Tax=Collybiopsis confluens TaxID=2823264 RepID=A0A8H5D3F1_9AGAR|nr:hypothetical protein D9757_012103 [Collybiopsis confluens]